MAMYLPATLESLARKGANITIEDSSYLPNTILNIAYIAKQTGSHVTIGGHYLPQTLDQLAQILGNQLTVVVSNK